MSPHPRQRLLLVVLLAAVAALFPAPLSWLEANGGTLRLANIAMGSYRVSAFTDPTPVRPDSLDVSVLIVHASSGEVVEGLRVEVQTRLVEPRHTHAGHGDTPPGETRLATREEADDPRYYATKFALGAEGRWELTVRVEGPEGEGEASFEVTARDLGLLGNPWILILLALFPLALVGGWILRTGGEETGGPTPPPS